MVKQKCSVAGCEKESKARELCSAHYKAWRISKMQKCIIEGCLRQQYARGLCSTHHARVQRYGDVNRCKRTPVRDFIENAILSSTETCIVWPFRIKNGYGVVQIDGVDKFAHRIVCEAAHGAPFQGANAAHQPIVCANRRCINPKHLRWATAQENQRDKFIDGTVFRGAQVSGAKLSELDIIEIRASRESHSSLGRRFGVSHQTIRYARLGRTWAHVDGSVVPRDGM